MRLTSVLLLPMLLIVALPAVAEQPYWQCAAFARQFSGIDIRGDAWTWWRLADGRYAKGDRPKVGAVLSFTPSGNIRLGHVATVTGIQGDRDITVTHANWSRINGVRGQIERDVQVRDVSVAGDWSRVRVWYAPLGDLGTTAWPVDGFIYADSGARPRDPRLPNLIAASTPARAAPRLAYAPIGQLTIAESAVRKWRPGGDLIRLAMRESGQVPRRPD